ncbi:MAG: nucleoside monophosphate kinase [Candidatus Levybacteria bacterium]|nr:nucleoside monophosphate kinase [Candidatus Levybacteria bacterium]MBI2189977.1 nucleoside monophosphate kinase [Candidatus Levybacteria bacterium]MBI2622932.1 nucleoside monophosphate kinase [Candidatus Levybacteria bacterium]MBI3070255.1 nucleoside monophosphate kinase [Candidatus Levybacteria bacterium]MBI3093006.1 nucleoside monophosphate kinase [Candidatus Levybacteria bacterium]
MVETSVGDTVRSEVERHRKKIIIFVGPEGSGKSTQGKLLSENLGVPYFATGDIVRNMARDDSSEMGVECRRALNEHGYVDPRLIAQIIADRLSCEDMENGCIIDGSFRTLNEILAFEDKLRVLDIENEDINIVYLRIPGWLSFERLTFGRKRAGDTEEGVLGRLTNHYRSLGERMSFARKRWKFVQVSAFNRSIKEIHEEIIKHLGK